MLGPPVVLLVEDREDDVLLIQRALTKGYINITLRIARNGDQALAYLSGDGEFADREKYPLPRLVLLDLKMPGRDGFDVLHWIRHQEEFKTMRVIVLTSSDQIRDVNRAYQLGANSFLVKPNEFENFILLARLLKDYWFDLDTPPQPPRPATPAPISAKELPN